MRHTAELRRCAAARLDVLEDVARRGSPLGLTRVHLSLSRWAYEATVCQVAGMASRHRETRGRHLRDGVCSFLVQPVYIREPLLPRAPVPLRCSGHTAARGREPLVRLRFRDLPEPGHRVPDIGEPGGNRGGTEPEP